MAKDLCTKAYYPASDWLTEFCYLLLVRGLPTGTLEEIVRDVERTARQVDCHAIDPTEDTVYDNGLVASYARLLAGRLRGECFIEMLTNKPLSIRARMRIRHGVQVWEDNLVNAEHLRGAVAAMQSTDDLGSPAANEEAMKVLNELMERLDKAEGS